MTKIESSIKKRIKVELFKLHRKEGEYEKVEKKQKSKFF